MRTALLLTLALLSAGCQTTQITSAPPVPHKVERVDSCTGLVERIALLSEALRSAYQKNEAIGDGQKAGAMLSLVPVVGLAAAGATTLAGFAKDDTVALRVLHDAYQDQLNAKLALGQCAAMRVAQGE